MTVEIPLSNSDRVAVIDNEDANLVREHRWYLASLTRPYAMTHICHEDGHYKVLGMHRLILGPKVGPDLVVHHRNGDELDNRKDNLQVMTRSKHYHLHAVERARRRPRTPLRKTIDGIEWIAVSHLRNLDIFLRMHEKGEPFVITYNQHPVMFAFPCKDDEDGQPTIGSWAHVQKWTKELIQDKSD